MDGGEGTGFEIERLGWCRKRRGLVQPLSERVSVWPGRALGGFPVVDGDFSRKHISSYILSSIGHKVTSRRSRRSREIKRKFTSCNICSHTRRSQHKPPAASPGR